MNATKTYILGFWYADGALPSFTTSPGGIFTDLSKDRLRGDWRYKEYRISNSTSFQFSGVCLIDEVRIFSSESQMSTYTYIPLVGITSQADANGFISYFVYDELGRLSMQMDDEGKIVKKYCYNYAGQQENCANPPQPIDLVSNNTSGIPHNVVMYNKSNGISYFFQLSGNGVILGSILPGIYDLEFSSVNGISAANHKVGCNTNVVYGNEVVMYDYELKDGCNAIWIFN